MCNGTWHGIADLLLRMQEMKVQLAMPIQSDAEHRLAIERALGNLIAIIDWFDWSNSLEVNPSQIEAEFDRYEARADLTHRRPKENWGEDCDIEGEN